METEWPAMLKRIEDLGLNLNELVQDKNPTGEDSQ